MDPIYERQILFHAHLRGVRCVVDDADATPDIQCKTMQTNSPGASVNAQDSDQQRADANDTRVSELLEQNSMLLHAITESLQHVEDSRRHSLRELQFVACELAVVAATYVTETQIEKGDFPIEKLVTQAINRLESDDPLTIHVHSDDLVRLNSMWESTDIRQPENVRFVADDSLARGSCFAESRDYGLLSTLDARFAEIRQALLEGIDDAQTERRRTDEEGKQVRRFPDRRETA